KRSSALRARRVATERRCHYLSPADDWHAGRTGMDRPLTGRLREESRTGLARYVRTAAGRGEHVEQAAACDPVWIPSINALRACGFADCRAQGGSAHLGRAS